MVQGLSHELAQTLTQYRRRWRDGQMACTAVDKPAAENAVRVAYAAAGLAPPERIIWSGGPRDLARSWRAAMGLGIGVGATGNPVVRGERPGRNVRHALIDELFARTVTAVERDCGRSLRQAVSETMRLGRPGPLGAAIIAASLEAIDEPAPRPLARLRLWAGRRSGSGPAGRLSFRDSGYSVHELGWLGTYQFLHDRGGVATATEPLSGLWQLAAHIGWIVPHERVCWLGERHHIVKADANERLHCADGPALAYPDGTAVYFWKGVPVPSGLIEHPDRITVRSIDRELDPVVRRCMIDIITPARYIAMGSAVRINQDETGVLWRKLWWGFDAWAAVEVVNGSPEPDGTFRHYFLQVPPTVRTAREAVAWTYGLSEHQYAQLKVRT